MSFNNSWSLVFTQFERERREMKFCVQLITVLILLKCTFSRKNVLFIIVDDLRPVLGCYGDRNARTPNIDRLANESIVFENAYVQQALCAPSRNSFLTSRRPDTLHLYDFYNYWRQSVGNFTTLPQYFKENGYHTVSIGKVFHPGISSNWTDDQPYSWSEEPYHPSTQQYKDARVCVGKDGQTHQNLVCPVEVKFQPGKSLPDLQSLEAAKEFLYSTGNGKKLPFFLAVGFHKPHVPLKYPKKFLDFHPLSSFKLPAARWQPAGLPTVAWNPWLDVRKRDDIAALNVSFPFGPIPDNYSAVIIQNYYAAVTYIDDLVGKLLDTLRKVDLYSNTIILLTADHGWSMAEHGEWSKYSNYEVAVKVPFILRVPGLTDAEEYPRTTNALTELVDIFPTLVELTDSGQLPLCPKNSKYIQLCTEGISLAPLINDIISQKDAAYNTSYVKKWKTGVFSQYPRPGLFPTVYPNSDKPHLKSIKIMGYSLRTARHRYTEWVQFDRKHFKPNWNKVYARELYDHHLDPEENLNLADRSIMSKVVNMLSAQLHAGWRYSVPRNLRMQK